MKNATRFSGVLTFMLLPICACERDNGMIGGVPISTKLIGTWDLERIETPTRSLSGSQLGYSEVLKSYHEVDDEVERVFRDDTLYAKHIWTRVPGIVSKASNMTVLITYRGSGLKRLYKIIEKVGEPTRLEATDYLPELGGVADTVKFYYKEVQ